MSKIRNESKSQRSDFSECDIFSCRLYVKDTKRKQITTLFANVWQLQSLQIICQRYETKANHNYALATVFKRPVVDYMSKIRNESKSQLPNLIKSFSVSCRLYVKDTKRKQITTKNSHTQLLQSCRLYVKDTKRKQITTYKPCLQNKQQLQIICQRYETKANHNK